MGTLTFQAALGGSVNLLGPNTASNINFTLPSADGSSGQPLQTNGSGTLSFANLAVANGGTGATSFTANQIHYGSFSQSAGLTFDGTNFATTGTATATKLIPTGTSVTGNGMYLPATNSVGISTAGTNAVYIDASQNVGIGTSSPAYKLDVAGSVNSNTSVNVNNTGTTANILFASSGQTGTTVRSNTVARIQSTAAGRDVNLQFSDNVSNAAEVGMLSGALYFATAGTERMRIDSSGNVGIGISSPSTYVSNGGLALAGAYGTSSTALAIFNSTAFSASNIARIDFRVNNSFGGNERVSAIWGLNPNAAANNGGALVFGTSPNGTATTPNRTYAY